MKIPKDFVVCFNRKPLKSSSSRYFNVSFSKQQLRSKSYRDMREFSSVKKRGGESEEFLLDYQC